METLLALELKTLKLQRVRPAQGGVAFWGTMAEAYAVCLWSRTASRLLLPLARFDANNADELYGGVREIRWQEHIAPEGSLTVDFSGTNAAINHSRFGAMKVKDAIVDQIRESKGVRPSVRFEQPDLRINVRLRETRATVSLDLSGESLHRRGYRIQSHVAPLKENLAAAILLLAQWPEIAARGGTFLDPMCGSGTLPIEAALLAGNIAPGLLRHHFGFLGWRGFDASLWADLLADAQEKARVGRASIPTILGFDVDPQAITAARFNTEKAGLAGHIQFVPTGIETLTPPESCSPGLLAVNPPYGERLGTTPSTQHLYRTLGRVMTGAFSSWSCAVFTGLHSADRLIGMKAHVQKNLNNGPLLCQLLLYPAKQARQRVTTIRSAPLQDGQMFANRLRKNIKQLRRWLHRDGVTCYRLYDADMPEYALAIDVYEQWMHVQEYTPPESVDPLRAKQRLQTALAIIPDVLDLPAENMFVKVRQRQTGAQQYGHLDQQRILREVRENGLCFFVNLSDYLDTGLFLDQAPVRKLIRDWAANKRFLNLFGYTGTASVYAADGGAKQTVTVDMSRTYLDWARKNFTRNGFVDPRYQFEQADCLEWLKTAHGHYDLIFLDPPSFSNSKRMAAIFDLQRDHVHLIQQTAKLLAPGGIIVFSNHLKRFKMDHAALSPKLTMEDRTAQALGPDFQRSSRTHHCWVIQAEKK